MSTFSDNAPAALTVNAESLAALTAAVGETAERYDRSAEYPRLGLEAAHRAGVFTAAAGGVPFDHAALYVGVARAAQRFLVRFAHDRVPTSLGRPIATTERIQQVAGEIEAQLVQAEELMYGLAARVAAGDEDAARRTLIAKPIIARSAVAAVETAVAALGNPALTRANPLERHLRDVQSVRVHPPQEDAALLATGRRVLDAGAP